MIVLVSNIQRAVADAHGIPVAVMRQRDGLGRRLRAESWARQEAMFLSREMCADPKLRCAGRASYPALGRLFRRDHSTVIHGVRAVRKRIASDPVVRRRIDSISVGLLIEGMGQ